MWKFKGCESLHRKNEDLMYAVEHTEYYKPASSPSLTTEFLPFPVGYVFLTPCIICDFSSLTSWQK